MSDYTQQSLAITHQNNGLFADYYLNEIVPTLYAWDDDALFAQAKRMFEQLAVLRASIQPERLIATLQERKRGLMQRLLTGEVHFPDFEDEWATKRFRDVFERVTRKNDEGNENVLTASAQYGLVSQTDFFSNNSGRDERLGKQSIRESL